MNDIAAEKVVRIAHDPDILEAFYRAHLDAVSGFVARRVADPYHAADLPADIFLAEVSYGGRSTGSLVVDEDGNATPGPAPELPEPAEQPASGDSGPAWSAGGGESGSTPQRADTPCGDVASLPVSLVRTGGDFVITIDGDSPFAKEDLRITTLDRGEGAELVVTFSPEPGARCGLGTSTP